MKIVFSKKFNFIEDSYFSIISFLKENLPRSNDPSVYLEVVAAIIIDRDDLSACIINNGNVKFAPERIPSKIYFSNEKLLEEEIYYKNLIQNGEVLNSIVSHLKNDLYSRRCLWNFWKEDYFINTKNAGTCISQIYFRYNNDSLEMHSHMRSNDIIQCYVLDVSFLMAVGQYIARELDVAFGGLFHFVDSFQVYNNDKKIFNSINK